jgi:hypothetical protein
MPLIENARSSGRDTPASVSPGLSGLEMPMAPDSRTTGTVGISLRNRDGISQRKALRGFWAFEGSAIVSAHMWSKVPSQVIPS